MGALTPMFFFTRNARKSIYPYLSIIYYLFLQPRAKEISLLVVSAISPVTDDSASVIIGRRRFHP